MKLGRDYLALKRWAHHTGASDCLLWHTPVAQDDQKTPEAHLAMKQRMGERDGTHANRTEITRLAVEVQGWRTPDAPGAGGPRNRQDSRGAGHQVTIAEQAEHWGTPNAADAIAGNRRPDGKRSPGLNTDAAQWQTPGTDSFRSRGGDRVNEMGLDQEARKWQSPQGRDFRSGEIQPETAAKHAGSRPLNEEVLNWPTSGASDAKAPKTFGRGNPSLTTATQNWPTARAEDGESCGNHPNAIDSLRGAVENWGTPKLGTNTGHGQTDPKRVSRVEDQALNWLTPHGAMGHEANGDYGCGGEAAKEATNWKDHTTSHLTEPATLTAGPKCWCNVPGCVLRLHKRKLNVYFDEWLQGWPVNWSSATKESIGFAAWERESRRLLWHLLSSYCCRPTESELGQTVLF